MTQTTPRPWGLIGAGSPVVTLAAYVGFLAADTFVCGIGHAVVIGILLVVWAPQALATAIAVAALLLALWRLGFKRDRIALAILLLSIAAALTGIIYAVSLGQDASFCRIEL
jgi:hypothetical protein